MRSFCLLTLLSGLLFACPASAAEWPDLTDDIKGRIEAGPRDAALVVAIEDYAFAQDIPGAVVNGRAWAHWLRDERKVGHLKVLYNEQATKEEILRAAQGLSALVDKGGRLWVVFIGHGAPSRAGDDGVLVGVDAQQTALSLEARSVPRRELIAALDGPQAETLLLLDACFSGKVDGGASIAPGIQPMKVVDAVEGGAVTVLTAAKSDQFAGALSDRRRPAFSYLALGAVRGWADRDDSGDVTAEEIRAYADDAVIETIVGRNQTATVEGPDLVVAAGGREDGPELSRLGADAFPELVPTLGGGRRAGAGISRRTVLRGLGYTGAIGGVAGSLVALQYGYLTEQEIREALVDGDRTAEESGTNQLRSNALYGAGYVGLAASAALGLTLVSTTGKGKGIRVTRTPGGASLGWGTRW